MEYQSWFRVFWQYRKIQFCCPSIIRIFLPEVGKEKVEGEVTQEKLKEDY